MSKAKPVIVDMDTQFEDVSFDERSINCSTSANSRSASHYKGSMTDPALRDIMLEKKLAGIKKAKEESKYSNASKTRYLNHEERQKTANRTKEDWVKNREVRLNANKNKWTPELKKQASESHIKQWDDEEKRQNLSKKMSEIRTYPLVTPDGVFLNTKEAGIFYNVGAATILYRIKKHPTEYYKISLEEYQKLKK